MGKNADHKQQQRTTNHKRSHGGHWAFTSSCYVQFFFLVCCAKQHQNMSNHLKTYPNKCCVHAYIIYIYIYIQFIIQNFLRSPCNQLETAALPRSSDLPSCWGWTARMQNHLSALSPGSSALRFPERADVTEWVYKYT